MGAKPGDRRYITALLVAIFTYTMIFSTTTIWKHNQFNSYTWDLGTFDQMLHNSVFEGRPFYYTLDLFMNPSGQYFAIHFSPILILLFPLYRLIPSPEPLLPTRLKLNKRLLGFRHTLQRCPVTKDRGVHEGNHG